MKLHWSSRSPYVRKVMICAYELGLADRVECIRSVVSMYWQAGHRRSEAWMHQFQQRPSVQKTKFIDA